MKFKLAVILALLSPIADAATPPPKVVFIGDYFTYNWTSAFAANPTWMNKGINANDLAPNAQTSSDVLARFQTDVINQHPAIVHIMVGNVNAETSSFASTQYTPPSFAADLDNMVKAATAANIKVILGISPGVGPDGGIGYLLPQIDSIIAAYGAANNIQVVNYQDAMCQCVGALGEPVSTPNNFQQLVTSVPSGPPITTLLPTSAGYAVMTQMAETAVANEYLTIETGWLSDIAMPDPYIGLNAGGLNNLNTVLPGAILQFTPVGYYSDGSTHPQTNTTWEGSNGTWTSSNPLVMSVNQQGLALATTAGTATIKYTPANGVYFSPWVMTVQ